MAKTCVKCGNPLEIPKTGRPPTFCSVACRRAAGYELTRINRHIERLETERIQLNLTDKSGYLDQLGRTSKMQLADCEKNIAELEARLLLLLEGSTDD